MVPLTRALALLALVVACRPAHRAPPSAGAAAAVLRRGGWIVDGTGNPRARGDLTVTGDRTTAAGGLPGDWACASRWGKASA